jgi:hypothetical protein
MRHLTLPIFEQRRVNLIPDWGHDGEKIWGSLMREMLPCWWSGFDIRYPPSRKRAKRMSNPKLHQKPIFASGPSILTFATVSAAMGSEC